ncbi:putative uncharacterized protein DDB_G0271606 [Myzus persicae]|uniref:putative uncharacterized protein DDB_G0271606 n=1 Tax=Myzus persicae TaxID=13164 RepID=UPI000B937D29|nr:putative uncharacterized protein DDB_G0271606 [Myzus persicae]
MGSTKLNIVLVLLQLTSMCMCQKFNPVYRGGPITTDRQIAAGQQQYTNDAALQSAVAGDVYQQYPEQQYNYPTQAYYYPPQQKQMLEKQQQSRLEQQRLQLQQLQQLQSSWAGYYQPAVSPQQQQYTSDYQQQLQQLQQQQQQPQQQQQQQQQQYYQTVEKPLFRPAAIPVNEAPAEGPQQQKPNSLYQQQNGALANQQLPQNPLGVYYSSAADVSKFQFSGNGVNYSY